MSEPRTVWKFPLHPGICDIPARVRHIGIDPTGAQAYPTAWCEVNLHNPGDHGYVNVVAFGTGHTIREDCTIHYGSVVTPAGFVWHVYGMRP